MITTDNDVCRDQQHASKDPNLKIPDELQIPQDPCPDFKVPTDEDMTRLTRQDVRILMNMRKEIKSDAAFQKAFEVKIGKIEIYQKMAGCRTDILNFPLKVSEVVGEIQVFNKLLADFKKSGVDEQSLTKLLEKRDVLVLACKTINDFHKGKLDTKRGLDYISEMEKEYKDMFTEFLNKEV